MGEVVSGVGRMVDNYTGTNTFGSNSNMQALAQQRQGTEQANAALTNSYNTQQNYLNPYAQAGGNALSTLSSGNLMDGGSITNDQGYQFRLAEGNKAINASAAARGMGNSGATMKALTAYGSNQASQEYDKAYNRNYQRLSGLANMGEQASTNQAQAAGQYGANMSNNYMGLGNASAAATMGMANQQTAAVNRAFQNAGTGMSMAGGGGGGMFSDERLKENITPVNFLKEDVSEMKKHLKAYSFDYIDSKHGEGHWIGIMAQDLEKSRLGKTLVFEDEDGHKKIDMAKAVSLFLATMAEG